MASKGSSGRGRNSDNRRRVDPVSSKKAHHSLKKARRRHDALRAKVERLQSSRHRRY
jgi:hypothetical protein